jgi:hypothetical protein
MSWRSLLFPNSPGARMETIIRETERKVDKLLQPIGDLGLAIVSAASKCTQDVEPYFRPAKDPGLQRMYVFCEFLYFFMHLTNRQAYQTLGSDKVGILQKAIWPGIASTAVDTFCAHWPEKFKSGIKGDFFNNLNNAELEYSSFKLLSPEKKPIDNNAMCSQLAMHILNHAGYDADVDRLSDDSLKLINLVGALVMDNLNLGPLKNLGEMVEKAGAALSQANVAA